MQVCLSSRILIAATLCLSGYALGQRLPVVKASSTNVDIKDGQTLIKSAWTISPEIKLDTYFARRSTKPKKVTFKTDIDSITFDLKPGDTKDFVILLNGNVQCHTRVSTERRSAQRKTATQSGASILPFILGRDKKIHIAGSVNDSPPLDFMFDTGADTIVLYPSSMAKIGAVRYNGTTENTGVGGTTTRLTSNDILLQIADLSWKDESAMKVEKQADHADGIIGWNIFEDKVVELNFDTNKMLIHDKLPNGLKGYRAFPMRWEGSLFMIQLTLKTGQKEVKPWLVVDSGANSAIMLKQSFCMSQNLYGTMKIIGSTDSSGVGSGKIHSDVVELPSLVVGGVELKNVPLQLESANVRKGGASNMVGTAVLKKFNMILDFQTNVIYLKPNELFAKPFDVNMNIKQTGK